MVNAEMILQEAYPNFKLGKRRTLTLKVFRNLLHESDFNEVIERNRHLRGFAFLDKLLEYCGFSYHLSPKSYNNIPHEGRLIIVANHPIGTLDGLALVKLIRSIRPDVRIVANRLLLHIEPLRSVFLPVDVMSSEKKLLKQSYKVMVDALNNEEAIIIFPAGEVSRATPKGIRDGKWKPGFLKLAKKTKSPILPIHIKASNSSLFYLSSLVYKPAASLLLVKEMFNKRSQELKFKVGSPIPHHAFATLDEPVGVLAQRFRKHVLNLEKKRGGERFFETVETVAHPVDRKALKMALYETSLLGETADGKKIFLYQHKDDCPIMQEIARLRELTFRSVEEGTGNALDWDQYDRYYSHLVLWDENDLEIVGAYRIGNGAEIIKSKGIEGFYTSTLFDFSAQFERCLPNSIELGRSFVQPRYWGRRSLDYLWYGIGAYLRDRPTIKYLFGPVSLSNGYPQEAKEVIVSFYKQQFSAKSALVRARNPFVIPKEAEQFAQTAFSSDYRDSYKVLNSELKRLGVKVPALYKQYAELCLEGGCQFIGFNVDHQFNDCIDSLVMVSLDKIVEKKRRRYIEQKRVVI